MLKRTPLHDFHVKAGAKLVEFAGWEMPILYRGIVEEHQYTRSSGGLFDVSHMGRLQFTGADAQKFLELVVTRGLADQQVGQSRYSLVCNESGGVLDDVIISRDEKKWVMVCNASNREKLLKHFDEVKRQHSLNFELVDTTESTAMIAAQGPKVIERLSELLSLDIKAMKRYRFKTTSVMMTKLTVYRSGYTGEDGVEVVLPAKAASMAMKMIGGRLDADDATIKPAGLGARDTLRLEAAMPLYGHELTEQIDPISAGLEWAVDLSKDFIGAPALRKIKQEGPRRRLVGLELEGRRIARQGTLVQLDGRTVGEVTSGTFGPTLQKSIALAYVDVGHSAEGTPLSVDLKGTANPARVVKLPFYKRKD